MGQPLFVAGRSNGAGSAEIAAYVRFPVAGSPPRASIVAVRATCSRNLPFVGKWGCPISRPVRLASESAAGPDPVDRQAAEHQQQPDSAVHRVDTNLVEGNRKGHD